ncbi:MAG: hypothetical protein GYB31_06530 [Bacteroidetes bacterium]|nr:hypothetical protein [Bacteroidota bacterium]
MKLQWTFIFLFFFACQTSEDDTVRLPLNSNYLFIDEIHSVANCLGPDGRYVTEVHSFTDSTYTFKQDFEYREEAFHASVSENGIGYVLNPEGEVVDTLSREVVEMVRSHDFHRIQTRPNQFYSDFQVVEGGNSVNAVDKLEHPVRMIPDESQEVISSVMFWNMLDTSEVIRIDFTDWVESDYGKLVKKLRVIQAERDTFFFDYTQLMINGEEIKF